MAATFKSRTIPERVTIRAATKYTVDANGCHIRACGAHYHRFTSTRTEPTS